MSKTTAQAAAEYRTRRAAKIDRMHTALTAIVAKLEGNDKALATDLRALAMQGLGQEVRP